MTSVLIEHLILHSGLDRAGAARVVDEVVAYFHETVEEFVRRRHLELQAQGLSNSQIYSRLLEEIAARPFAAAPHSLRQIRRIIYG